MQFYLEIVRTLEKVRSPFPTSVNSHETLVSGSQREVLTGAGKGYGGQWIA